MGRKRRLETTSRQLLRISRLSGLLLPGVVFAYLLTMYSYGGVNTQTLEEPLILLAVFGWTIIGVMLAREKTAYRQQSIGWIGAYHLIFAMILLFVVGFHQPIVFLWSILLLLSFTLFGLRGALFSMTALLGTALADGIMGGNIVDNAADALIIVCVGGVAISILQGANTDQAEIDSAREQSELQHERLRTLINNLTDAIIALDTNGRIMLYNAATLSLLDTNTSIDNQYIDDVFELRNKDNTRVKLSKILKSIKAVTVRDDLRTSISDEMTRLELTLSPIRTTYSTNAPKRNVGWIVIIRDVTTTKSLEEERDEFISVVSHELRTPITVAEGTLSNVQLMMERGGVSKSKLRPAVDMAHDQIVFLSKMVNDLSTLSRAERGVGDQPEPINVDDLIHRLYNDYHAEAQAKGLQLNLQLATKLGTIHASRLYVQELLQNLITNAIKYTHEGTITIDASVTKSHVMISVIDTGIGISKADQKRIFDKFYRAEDYRTRETNGTGLGLYVAVKLAKKLGSRIEMKSRLNHGSTFSVSLPITED